MSVGVSVRIYIFSFSIIGEPIFTGSSIYKMNVIILLKYWIQGVQ